MASIIKEQENRVYYRNADGWNISDKIFGYADSAVNTYNKLKSGVVSGVSVENNQEEETGVLGLKKPWGAVILGGGGLAVLIFILWKIAK
jgi:hypothetical protein